MPEKGGPLCPKSKPCSLRSAARRLTRKKVLKMLAVMEPRQQNAAAGGGEPSNSHSQEFLTSGRTGRRNALPDILSEHAIVTSADLPARLQKLSTQDGGAGPSTSDGAGPSKDPKQANSGS